MNEILNKSSLFVEFDYVSKDKNSQKKHAKFKIGDGNNEVRYSLIQKVFEITNKTSKSDNTFTNYLANEIYSSLSDSEKQLVQILKTEIDTSQNQTKVVSNVEINIKENNSSVTDYEVKVGGDDNLDEYLNDLKLAEEYTFKLKEENKYRKKMEKISGITPMDEMMVEMAGTSVKPSNMHHTDWNRLNDHKINSPSFV